ncbi:hypothetical protein [Mesorhizobium australicum]|uniref:Secretin/TonB short N-terminal domain-containing protein n=1 Tax=Mesorhizobium australicum TaxID=536018 RepID=A0A1X7P2D9_9HYPH|nr:hypothetical protein [Mesorhizobium australicum]SMH44302.1 hypothetical protein SAMN02982922_3035 [Mesorhizobium australicum]
MFARKSQITEPGWKGRRLHTGAALPAAAALLLAGSLDASAEMAINGDAKAMTVTISEMQRGEVMAEMAQRFGFKVAGQVGDDQPINGRFRGDLGDVLAAILPANGFLIVYEGGRPTKLVLSDRSQEGAAPVDPSMTSMQPNGDATWMETGEGGHGAAGLGGGQVIDPTQTAPPPSQEMPPPEDVGPPPEPEL